VIRVKQGERGVRRRNKQTSILSGKDIKDLEHTRKKDVFRKINISTKTYKDL